MSHFRVIAALPPDADKDALERVMLPYHEFECTGIEAHIVDVDILPKLRKEYAEQTEKRVRLADGSEISRYDDACYRDPTDEEKATIGPAAGTGGNGRITWTSRDWGDGRGYRMKVWGLPEGATEFERQTSEAMSFVDFVREERGADCEVAFGAEPDIAEAHKYGWWQKTEDGTDVARAIRRTNPNAKWDGYQIGGRYRGVFNPLPGGGDVILRGHLDLDLLALQASARRLAHWDEAEAEFKTKVERAKAEGKTLPPGCEDFATGRNTFHDWWAAAIAAHQAGQAAGDAPDDWSKSPRHAIEGNPEMKALWLCMPFGDPDEAFRSREDCSKPAEPFYVHAYVDLEGKWVERGEGGWFGAVADEKPRGEWYAQVAEWLKGLGDDTILVNIDIHI